MPTSDPGAVVAVALANSDFAVPSGADLTAKATITVLLLAPACGALALIRVDDGLRLVPDLWLPETLP